MAGGTIITSGAYPLQKRKDIDNMIYDAYSEAATEWQKLGIFSEMPMPKGGVLTMAELVGLNLFREVGEGSAVDLDVPAEGHEKSLEPTQYGGGLVITQNALEDDRFGNLKDLAAGLGKHARYVEDLIAMAVLANAGDTELAWDGKPLVYYHASTGHRTLKTDEAVDNRPSVDAALSETALQAAFQYYWNGPLSEEGRPLDLEGTLLLVPSDTKADAYRIQKQMVGINATTYSNNSQMNLMAPGNNLVDWEVFGSKIMHRLGSTNDWMLIDKKNFKIPFAWSRKLVTDVDYDKMSMNHAHVAFERYAVGSYQYKPIYGSFVA